MSIGQALDLPSPAPRALRRLPHRGRPSDRLERWPVAPASVELLHAAAGELGMAAGAAGCLLAEHGLLLQEIGHDGVEWLDACARRATVRHALDGAPALAPRSPGAPADDAADVIRLPARLTHLLTAAGGPEIFLSGDLDQARRWERAALIDGATMTEWAWTTLRDGSAYDD